MRWFRSHLKLGSRCALFALAVQLVVAFGHGHRADFSGSSRFLLDAVASEHSAAALPGSSSAPSDRAGFAFDYCAICAVMNLAASAVPAAAPGLSVPIVVGQIRFWVIPDISLIKLSHASFEARAPPLS
jgi:hypothetical protein